MLASTKATAPPTVQPGANDTTLAFLWAFGELAVEVRYSLVSAKAKFVEKQLRLLPGPADSSEKDAKLAQKLGQLQPFIAVFPRANSTCICWRVGPT